MYGLDLFSGIGGITKALEGYVQPVAYCENDRYAQGVLLSRMANGDLPNAPIWSDILTLRGAMLPRTPEIIYGGFPCQDISVAGRGKGLDGERITDEKGGGLWPTPRANKVGGYSSPGFRPTLEQTVKMWPTPNPGEHGRGGQNLSTEVGGQLNPMWVEWLMGYLSAWTALEDWAIVWFRLKRGKHLK